MLLRGNTKLIVEGMVPDLAGAKEKHDEVMLWGAVGPPKGTRMSYTKLGPNRTLQTLTKSPCFY